MTAIGIQINDLCRRAADQWPSVQYRKLLPKEKALTALRQTNRIIFTSGDRTELSVTDPPNFRSDTAVLGDDAGNVASLGCRADVFGGMADDGASGEAEQQDYNLENPTRAHPGAESPLCPYALPGTHAAYGQAQHYSDRLYPGSLLGVAEARCEFKDKNPPVQYTLYQEIPYLYLISRCPVD
eukprot:733138-Rhodomonas_salina.4